MVESSLTDENQILCRRMHDRWSRTMESQDPILSWPAINWEGGFKDLKYGKITSKEDFQYHFESILSPDGMNGSCGIYAGRMCVYNNSGIFIEIH